MLSQQNSLWLNPPPCKSMHSAGEKMRNVEKEGGGRGETERDEGRERQKKEDVNDPPKEGEILHE